MKYYRECRIRFVGDRDKAASYIPQARNALGRLWHRHMSSGALFQMRDKVTLADGTVFTLDANRVLPSITIDVTGIRDVIPRDIFVSGYTTAPGSNAPINGWLEGLKYVPYEEDKKLYGSVRIVWSPSDEAPVRNVGTVVYWKDNVYAVGHNVKMRGYARHLLDVNAVGNYLNLDELGVPLGGPQQERIADSGGNRDLYLLYSVAAGEASDNTRFAMATFTSMGRLVRLQLLRGQLEAQISSLAHDSQYVFYVGRGIPEGVPTPNGAADPLDHTPYTLFRQDKETGALALLTYFWLPEEDAVEVRALGCITSNNGVKFISCMIHDKVVPGVPDAVDDVARYHPFAYLDGTNGAYGILDTCFWLVNPDIHALFNDAFFFGDGSTSLLAAPSRTMGVYFHDSLEDDGDDGVERYIYCIMQVVAPEFDGVGAPEIQHRRIIVKLLPDTQEVVAYLLMENVYMIKLRGDDKDLYFNARIGDHALSGNMTSGGLRAGLFRIPKSEFTGEVDPEDVQLIWEREDPSTCEDFELVYTGPDGGV